MSQFLQDRRAVLLGLAASAAAPMAHAAPAPQWTAVRALIGRYVDERRISGACAILRLGGAATTIAGGYGALGAGRPADTRTIWRIFSMSKPVTGVAALALIEDGKLGLDQPVADFLPAFAQLKVLDGAGERPAKGVMRVRHLLTHTAGLGYGINSDALAARYREAGLNPGDPTPRPDTPQSLEEFGARLATMPLNADPGTRHDYSVALDLLGLVIQKASGKPFESYLKERLFDPLGMPDTGFFAPPSAADRLSMNYRIAPEGIVPLEPPGRSPYLAPPAYPSGGGGMVSTAQDYDRFCTMLLRGGDLDGVRVLSRATAARAHANLLPRGVMGESGEHFGAGMGVITRASAQPGMMPPGTFYWGGAAGTFMWMDPRLRLSVVLMTQFMPSRGHPLWDELQRAAYADLAA
jgi:CubicO group peptidase (beta-lactamase class C family)